MDRRDQGLVEQDLRCQPGRRCAAHADQRQVQPAVSQFVGEQIGIVLGKRDLDTRVHSMKVREQVEKTRHPARGHHSDHDTSAYQAGELVRCQPGGVHCAQSRAGVRKHCRADLGEPYRAARPVEELLAELALESADLSTDPRLGHVHAAGRAGEARFFGHGHEVLKLV